MENDELHVSKGRWPAPLEHLEEFITSSGHDLTIDHSRGERIEEKYEALQQKINKVDENGGGAQET